MTTIVEDIGRIVAAMPEKPYYLYGHKLYIANRLLVKNNDAVEKEEKYPLVALFMDFPELVEDGLKKCRLHVVIMTLTDRNYPMEERESKTFVPILRPLYESFMTQLRKVGKFTWTGDRSYVPHTATDRPYWGIVYDQGNQAYIFNDRLDAIEITDLQISKTLKKC